MPREIVQISVGQCGNQIGHVFWKRMLEEHNIGNDGHFKMDKALSYEDLFKLDKIHVFFKEIQETERFVPRAALIDLEPGVIDKHINSDIGGLFAPDYILTRASGAGNNWAKGHYTLGGEVIDEAMDIIRKYVESCDQLQGFQLTQSIGGGTGSGFGSLVCEKLRDNYVDRIITTYSIFPTAKVSDVVVEPYNAILSLSYLLEDTDQTHVLDNEALFNISQKVLKQKNPNFADLNWVLSLVMSGVTGSLRFPGILNCDLRKMSVNLVPFPRLHFFSSSYSPIVQQGSEWKLTDWNLETIASNAWSENNFVTSTKHKEGKFMAATMMYRGADISAAEVDEITRKHLTMNDDDFVEWIPHNLKTAIITLKPPNVELQCCLVTNTTAVKDVFERIWDSFDKLFSKKAFLHWYRAEGMHEMEFSDSEQAIKDLITDYQQKQEIVIDYDALYADDFEDDTLFSQESVTVDLAAILADKGDEKEEKKSIKIITAEWGQINNENDDFDDNDNENEYDLGDKADDQYETNNQADNDVYDDDDNVDLQNYQWN